MIRIAHRHTFRQPAHVVFAALTDYARASEWDRDVIEERLEPVGAPRVGSRIYQARKFMGSRVESVAEILEFEPNRLTRSASIPGSKQPVSGSYRLEPVQDGVRLEVEFELSGVPRLAEPLARWMIERSLTRRFRTLERLLETRLPVPNAFA